MWSFWEGRKNVFYDLNAHFQMFRWNQTYPFQFHNSTISFQWLDHFGIKSFHLWAMIIQKK